MKIGIFFAAMIVTLGAAAAAEVPNSRLQSVEPGSGKTGDVVGAAGEAIDKSRVEELYLTDGTTDWKVEVLEQSESSIKFKIPKIKAGRYSLMLKTTGPEVKLLEQPVRFTVEE